MFPNNRATKNYSKEWCTLESIVQHGIINHLLTHLFQRSTKSLFPLVKHRSKGLNNVNVKVMMFIFIVKLGFSVMAIIISYEAQSTPFPWSIELNTQLAPFVAFLISCSCDLSPLSHLLNCNSFEATWLEMLRSKFDFNFIYGSDKNEA